MRLRLLVLVVALTSSAEAFVQSATMPHGAVVSCGMRHVSPLRRTKFALKMAGEPKERALTNEECDILNLPRGSKLVGEMSEMMSRQLNTKGKYEDTNGLRYFGNEKIRASNYFGKEKIQYNVVRMNKKMRRAEIESLMDQGYRYEDAEKIVDSMMENAAANAGQAPAQAESAVNPELAKLFRLVDRDGSGSITFGEMVTAFKKLRTIEGKGIQQRYTDAEVLRDAQVVLAEMDVDASGDISFEEFCQAASIWVERASGKAPEPKQSGGWNPFQGLFGGK